MARTDAGRARQAKAQQVRQDVLDAAITVFADKGFDGGRIGEIAALSGVKQSLVLYHFGDKNELWEAAAALLMARFDRVQLGYYRDEPAGDDQQRLRGMLKSFIRALRDLPAYGKLLLKEGSHPSQRMLWLDHHYVPKVYRDTAFDDPALSETFATVNLLRYAVAGAVLFIIVAGPQIAVSAAEEGGIGDSPGELYPLSETLTEQLADMLCHFVLQQLGLEAPSAAG